jgi:DnaJ-class molecular chaperone
MNREKVMIFCAGALCAIVVCALSLFLCAHGGALCAWAKEQAFKVTVNDKEVQITPVASGDMQVIPLSFPLEEGKSTWNVSIDYNKADRTIKIGKTMAREKLRDVTICSRCGGNGRCPSCYPAGSGRNISGTGPCYSCDGTGKCFYCNGYGSY